MNALRLWNRFKQRRDCLLAVLAVLVMCAQAVADPSVTNVSASQRPNTKLVDNYYDLVI